MVEQKEKPDVELALKFKQEPYSVTLTSQDVCLYSLGIGFLQDPSNEAHLRYTYENADKFAPFPTNSLVVCHRGPFADGNFDITGIPPFNPMQLLHGEESITIEKPLKYDTKYII